MKKFVTVLFAVLFLAGAAHGAGVALNQLVFAMIIQNNTFFPATASVAAPASVMQVFAGSNGAIGIFPYGASATGGRASVVVSGSITLISEVKWDGTQISFDQNSNDGPCTPTNSTVSSGAKINANCEFRTSPGSIFGYLAQFGTQSVRPRRDAENGNVGWFYHFV